MNNFRYSAYMKRFLWIMIGVCLSACTPPPVSEPPVEQPAVNRTEENDLLPEDTTQSGVTIVERLLPTGLLEVGDRYAEVTLLMFTEHHCRYCKEFYREHFSALHRDFIDPGYLRLQIGILPLKKYKDSSAAATGLYCAAEQQAGIPMHELLFTLGASSQESLLNQAASLELNIDVFTECLTSERAALAINQQTSLARSLNVTLVPTFFLNGKKSVGLPYYADLQGEIEALFTEE